MRHYAAGLLLALCASLACADDDAVAKKDAPQQEQKQPEQAKGQKLEQKHEQEQAPKQAQKLPRRPDTAGWRRIMAGAGRT
jgi:hypothetical protein